MNGPKLHWMKVSFVYNDGYLIQLQFAFRRSLRNSVPLHGKRNFVWQAFVFFYYTHDFLCGDNNS